jgi:hypothetical protein
MRLGQANERNGDVTYTGVVTNKECLKPINAGSICGYTLAQFVEL